MAGPLAKWLSRHQDPTSFWLHMIGIPTSFVAAPVMLVRGHWLMGVALFVGGYAIQFIGHLIEGNRSGEEELLRKILKRPPPAE